MEINPIEKLEELLLEFVEKVVKDVSENKCATTVEIEVLPEVAQVILNIHRI